MKHYISLLGMILFCSLFFTGCGLKKSDSSKVLECSTSNTIGSASSEEIYKIYFHDGKVDYFSLNINVTLNESDTVTRDNLESEVDSAFANYKNRKGISYSSDINDNSFNVKMDINYNELSDDDKISINIINSENSYDEIKNELETNGFLCK